MKTYALATLGCKVNQYEGALIEKQLAGLANVRFGEKADLYIINSCAVTAEAEAKARQLVNRARRAAPEALLVLAGCWPPAKADAFRALGVDLFFNNAAKAEMVKRLPLLAGGLAEGEAPRPPQGRTRAFVKVQDGCDQFCSYCAVPLYRPVLKSRPIDDVVEEVCSLAAAGVPEVVLTGIHLGKYGADLGARPNLPGLIKAVLADTGVPRLRLSSIEPPEVTDELVELMAGEPRVARHLHVPLQSGSDKILTAMNRNYTTSSYSKLVKYLRRRLPRLGLTTDVIVGFPGETTGNFKATLDLIAEAAFSRLHVFKFSPRPGTAAASMSGQVKPGEKQARAREAASLGAGLAADFADSFVGQNVSVVAERTKGGRALGLTSEYVQVEFEKQALGDPREPVDAVGINAKGNILTVRRIDG